MSEKFSRGIHLKRGGLHGWCAHCPAEARHRALRETVQRDGYATTVRRVNFLANVASRSQNENEHRVAREDVHWLEREFGSRRE